MFEGLLELKDCYPVEDMEYINLHSRFLYRVVAGAATALIAAVAVYVGVKVRAIQKDIGRIATAAAASVQICGTAASK